ncbi:MAG: hypothetical protein JXR96_05285 [Deltaproteobacteria bacterium]|nr:hypothetical protein [Deltaproteobacteria bacterium]
MQMLLAQPTDQMLRLFLLHVGSIWKLDEACFRQIEDRVGLGAACEIAADCQRELGQREAEQIPGLLDLEQRDVPALVEALKHGSWALDLPDKSFAIDLDETRASLVVSDCALVASRREAGLGVIECQRIRLAYLEAFVRRFSPRLEVRCLHGPAGRQSGPWCSWEFSEKA